MKLQDWLNAVNNKVTEGWEYQWTCFDNPYAIESVDEDQYYTTVVFNSITSEVYYISVSDYRNNANFIWFNKDQRKKYFDYVHEKGIDGLLAYDDFYYREIESKGEFLHKLKSIVSNEDYDSLVKIDIYFNDDTLNYLFHKAHEQDITLNQLINELLQEEIDRRNTQI